MAFTRRESSVLGGVTLERVGRVAARPQSATAEPGGRVAAASGPAVWDKQV